MNESKDLSKATTNISPLIKERMKTTNFTSKSVFRYVFTFPLFLYLFIFILPMVAINHFILKDKEFLQELEDYSDLVLYAIDSFRSGNYGFV